MAEILVNNQIPIVSHKYKNNVQFSLGPLIIRSTKIFVISSILSIILIFQLPHMTTCLDLRHRQPSEE